MGTKYEKLIGLVERQVEGQERLEATMAATLELLQEHTGIKPVSDALDSSVVQQMMTRIELMFEAETTDGVVVRALPVLLQSPRLGREIEAAVSGLVLQRKIYHKDGMIYRNTPRGEVL